MAGQRRPWLHDFHADENGAYAYRGSHKKFSGAPKDYRRFRLTFGVFAFCQAALVIATGCLPVSALYNTAYVMLPYLIEVLLTAAFVWAAVRLISGGELLRSYAHRQTAQRLPKLCVALAASEAVMLTCIIIYAALHRPVTAGLWTCLALQGVLVPISLYCFKVLRAAHWDDV